MFSLLKKKRFYLALIIIAGLLVAGVFLRQKPIENTYTATVEGVTLPANVGKQYLQLYDKNSRPHNILLKGVNMGMAKPGHFPGEAAITKDEYLKWFKEIGSMNANVIRIYTLHPPAFYEALSEYNARASHPLYVLHGIWIDEDKLISSKDAYNEDVTKELNEDIKRTVDVIHGQADLPARPGHASGKYRADISKYVIGWVLGIEWDPEMVKSTNEKHQGKPDFVGTYFRTEHASPFEVWLAGAMDEIAAYETGQYSWQRPISFTNWVTTDLLSHPSEPMYLEDWVSVNPNVIQEQPKFHGGYFASYHVYPYYPEFLNYETKYTGYVDARGEKNSYAGYLHDLKQAHHMPVLIAEFGVPSSRGMAHRNINGWDQGLHSEQEQGNIDAHLFEDIRSEGMAGGIIFSWQDEWFKRTWNTDQVDNPDRRPFWSNAQTGEQQFGLLSFDPGDEKTAMYVDGDTTDWNKNDTPPVPIKSGAVLPASDGYDQDRKIKQWYVISDDRYVYFRIDFEKVARPFDWSKVGAMILLDTIPGQGQQRIPGGSGLTTDAGIDFAIDLKGPKKSRIWVDSYYDTFYYEYGSVQKLLPGLEYANKKNNGIFHTMKLLLNYPLEIPKVNGKTLQLPLEAFETGALTYGNGNPDSPNFDSLTDVSYNAKEHVVEVRIPWQLLNVKDPSTHEVMGDIWKDGLASKREISGFKVSVLSYRPDNKETSEAPGGAAVSYSSPEPTNGSLMAKDMYEYHWDKWDIPVYHERLKKSYFIMKDLFGASDVLTSGN
ncbi:hypothetical protein [Paenibacillus sp. sptzw28]|uniref:hypothetical protein n=1 Tax=Paenibacillus sp. sptzw28 TaxID=715179 RepID=UPI0021624614|nr:hypothetical protein [Paenibacillus sp. sptzw28]